MIIYKYKINSNGKIIKFEYSNLKEFIYKSKTACNNLKQIIEIFKNHPTVIVTSGLLVEDGLLVNDYGFTLYSSKRLYKKEHTFSIDPNIITLLRLN